MSRATAVVFIFCASLSLAVETSTSTGNLSISHVARPQTPSLDEVVKRASAYVETYTRALSDVVGEEDYEQRAAWDIQPAMANVPVPTPRGGGPSRYPASLGFQQYRVRRTIADFRTTAIGDRWFGMRRVREVDGVAVDPFFRGRLGEFFDQSNAAGQAKMQRALAFENSRFNIGDFGVTTNLPTFPLEVLRSDHIAAYSVSKIGEEIIDHVRTWQIKFEERSRSKTIEGYRNHLSGVLSIDPVTGQVYRATAAFDANMVATPSFMFQEIPSMHMSVRFARESAVDMLVPISMDTYFEGSYYKDSNVEGHALYSGFHRFGSDVRLDATAESSEPDTSGLKATSASEYAIKVDVPVVTVDAWVTRDNQPVLNLTADDFEIAENGVPQTITNFSPVDTPFDVLLLFDRSGSMSERVGMMTQAAQGMISRMRPQDHVGVASFGNTLRMLTHWTDTPDVVAGSLSGIDQGSKGTVFYRAVEHSLVSELIPVAGRRRALVVLTDGGDFSLIGYFQLHRKLPSPHQDPQFMQMIDVAAREHVPVYVVAINMDFDALTAREKDQLQSAVGKRQVAEYMQASRERLEELSRVSGGQIVLANNWKDVVPIYSELAAHIGRAYSIGYSSTLAPNAKGYREISLKTRDKNLVVTQSRQGYTLP